MNCGQRALSEIGHQRGAKHDSKIETAVKGGVVNGVEQVPNGIPNEKKGRVGGRRTRRIRAKEEKECGLHTLQGILHRFVHSRSQQMTARMVVGLCNMAST
jgi:hypothetical protein